MSLAVCPATAVSCVLDVFLADGCLSDGAGEVGGKAQIRRCKMAGRGWTQLQIEADGCMREYRLGFPSPWCPGVSGVNSQLRCGSSYCGRRKRASHTFITKTHWKSSWGKEKKTDHSSTEVTQPLGGTAVYLCRVWLLQIRRRAWQNFHFCHWLILYDWTVMGFGGSNPIVFKLFLF